MSIEKLLKTGELASATVSATAWSISVARSCRQVGSVLAIAPKKPKREKRSAKRLLAQPQNMAMVNVSLEPNQNCPKKHKCVFSPLASNLKKHRRFFLLYCRFQTKHKCVSSLFWEMQWKTHTRFFFRLSNDPKKYTKIHQKKNTKKPHPRHRCSNQFGSNTKGIESTLAWELWLHQQLVALQQHQPCRKEKKTKRYGPHKTLTLSLYMQRTTDSTQKY